MGIPTRDEVADVVANAEVVSRNEPVTLDTVTATNKAEFEARPVDITGKRKQVIDAAVGFWGDESMLELGKLLKERKTSVSGATEDDLNWALTEIQDRQAAIEAEKG